jgi:hypothetical protein
VYSASLRLTFKCKGGVFTGDGHTIEQILGVVSNLYDEKWSES